MSEHFTTNAALTRPRLPPELCDQIIDKIADTSFVRRGEPSPLSPLALTCRDWLIRVRYHRWAEVLDLHDHQCVASSRFRSFVALIHWIPEIGPCVKTLHFTFESMQFLPPEDDEDGPIVERPLIKPGIHPRDRDTHADLNALIREDTSDEEIVYGLCSKLVNLTYLDIDSYSFIFTPRLARHFSKLEFLQLCMSIFRSWAEVREVLQALPRIRKIFLRRTVYDDPREAHPASSDVVNPAPYLDEVGVTSFPELMSDFHRIFIAGSSRSPEIDLSVGKTTRWGRFRQMSMRRTRFMLSKHPEYEYTDVDEEDDDDDLYLDRLDPCIRFYEVELIPDWEEYTDTALSSMFSWLTQITRDVRHLIIRLFIDDVAMLQSDDWMDITRILQTAFAQVQSLTVRFQPLNPFLIRRAKRPEISILASEIGRQLRTFARSGRLRFQVSDYVKMDHGEDSMIWECLEKSDDGRWSTAVDTGSSSSGNS